MKNLISYYFSKEIKDNKGDKNNNINQLILYVNELVKQKHKTNKSIRHYSDNYGYVPLWVLMNILTFGNITVFYDVMKIQVRNEIAKIIGNNIERINVKQLLNILRTVNVYRNSCAHEDRLYVLGTR
jgi:abortive infection bacteriophage resistance protein